MKDILVVIKEFEFGGRYYKLGDRFKIIGEDPMRGFDIEDMNGNKIYETRMMSSNFRFIRKDEIRDDKLKDLGI